MASHGRTPRSVLDAPALQVTSDGALAVVSRLARAAAALLLEVDQVTLAASREPETQLLLQAVLRPPVAGPDAQRLLRALGATWQDIQPEVLWGSCTRSRSARLAGQGILLQLIMPTGPAAGGE